MAQKKWKCQKFCWRHVGVMFCVLLATFLMFAAISPGAYAETSGSKDELRGIWISYLDWQNLPSSRIEFQKGVDQILNRCVELRMNAVFVHVRSDADAMYPSKYYPWSRFITGTQGKDPGYDPLAYFIEAAHERKLEFHAWINPYRVTGYQNRWEQVCSEHPAKQWLTDADDSNDRWVIKQGGEYYFNPAVPQVRELIKNGVQEVVENYDVDGIHFDDYFYPELDDNDPLRWFDKPEYDTLRPRETIVQWRRNNINALIKDVYSTVKSLRPSVQFGISPEGFVDNLRSNTSIFADIDTWVSQPGYVDYVMPQLYWGFEPKLFDGSLAPYAFENNLKTWIGLKHMGDVKLYLGLAMYKAGSGTKDNNQVPEWLRRNDIIKREVLAARESGEVSGFCFYSYSSFQEAVCQQEVSNLMKIF